MGLSVTLAISHKISQQCARRSGRVGVGIPRSTDVMQTAYRTFGNAALQFTHQLIGQQILTVSIMGR